MKLKIKFIGTGSGKTSLNRFHSSILISSEKYNLLVDAGDGISRALLSQKINYNSINGIIFTHLHPDHFAGLPSLIVQMKMDDRRIPLDIFVHNSLKSIVENLLLHSNLLPERMKFDINYKIFSEDERISISKNVFAVPRKNLHLDKLENYKSKYPQLNFLCFSLLFEIENYKIIYTSDIGNERDLFLFEQTSTDIFITETTHIQPSILFDELKKINSQKIYLTHISEDSFSGLNEILAIQPESFQNKVEFAVDGLFVEI